MSVVYSQVRKGASHALARVAVLCLALAASGCAGVTPFASLAGSEDVTGSIPIAASVAPTSPPPAQMALSPDDWGYAQGALARALDPQGPATAVPWSNPASGLRGEITPVGAVYVAEGEVCRAFLAEIAGQEPVRRLQGRGCRGSDGLWSISDVKPFAT
jgi:surface antigen